MTDIYCPICARLIEPENIEEVESGEHEGFIYVHDDIAHADDDIDALESQFEVDVLYEITRLIGGVRVKLDN